MLAKKIVIIPVKFRKDLNLKNEPYLWCWDCYRKFNKIHSKEAAKVQATLQREYNWKKWGIINADGTQFTMVDYRRHFQLQNGKCKLTTCNKTSSGRAMCADHDHITHKFRGLLCNSCNKDKVGNLTLEEALAVVDYLRL